MGVRVQQSGDTRSVLLEGKLTLSEAPEIRTALMKALIEADDVIIRFGDIGEVDLSCLQLLCSAHRSAGRLRKKVRFEGNIPNAIQEYEVISGYARHKGCAFDTDGSCLWITTEGANHG